MSQRCDHCGGKLGVLRHAYFGMEFCDDECEEKYKKRLSGSTLAKIQALTQRDQNSARLP